jgi:hypothetical protein
MHTHADGGRSEITGAGKVHQRRAVDSLVRISLDSFHIRMDIRSINWSSAGFRPLRGVNSTVTAIIEIK